MRLSFWVAATALALVACSPGPSDAAQPTPQAAATVHPESGLGIIPLKVRSGAKVHQFRVEVARSPAEQARGLMFRRAMGADEGMVFPMNPPRAARFWMHNTVISLDIIFIGADGRILNIMANTVPYDDAPHPSAGVVRGVLELNGGRADALGIHPGDLVEW